MPVMVEVDCDDGTVIWVSCCRRRSATTATSGGHFCVYDEKFIRRHDGDQPQTHAHCVARPRCEYGHLRAGPLVNWPKSSEWEEALTSPGPTMSTLRPALMPSPDADRRWRVTGEPSGRPGRGG